MIGRIKDIALTAALAFSMGVGAGIWLQAKMIRAAQTDALIEVRKEDRDAVADMQAKEAALSGALKTNQTKTEAHVDAIRKIQPAHIDDQSASAADRPAADLDARLPDDVVRVLNAARADAAARAAAVSDGAGAAGSAAP